MAEKDRNGASWDYGSVLIVIGLSWLGGSGFVSCDNDVGRRQVESRSGEPDSVVTDPVVSVGSDEKLLHAITTGGLASAGVQIMVKCGKEHHLRPGDDRYKEVAEWLQEVYSGKRVQPCLDSPCAAYMAMRLIGRDGTLLEGVDVLDGEVRSATYGTFSQTEEQLNRLRRLFRL